MTAGPATGGLREQYAAIVNQTADPTKAVGRRCLQALLDRVLEMTAGILVAVVAVVLLVHLGVSLRQAARVGAGGFLATFMILSIANEVVLPRYGGGSTVGMEVFGLRLVTMAGERASWKALILRWLLWQVDGLFFAVVGIVVMLSTRRHQRLGDLVAGTLVIRSRRSVDEPVLPGPDRELGTVPQPELPLRAGQVGLDRRQ